MHVLILHQAIAADAAPDERDVLQQTEAVGQALVRLGHRVQTQPCSLDLAAFDAVLEQTRPDVVFNLVESVAGAGRLIHLPPALLDARRCPYTGNSAEALFLTSHKLLAKERLRAAGLPTPAWVTVTAGEAQPRQRPTPEAPAVPPPPRTWLVKSVWEHASQGMDDTCLVREATPEELTAPLKAFAARTAGECFAEEFVDGREFNVGLLAGPEGVEILPPSEIVFTDFPAGKPKIIGYQAKWATESFEYQHTVRRVDFAPADAALLEVLKQTARACWEAFDLAGYARVDFRVDRHGQPWVLEINTNPCISPDAGFAAMLARAGITYDLAITRLLDDARQRAHAFRHPDETPRKRAPTAVAGKPADLSGRTEASAQPATYRYAVRDGDRASIRELAQATGFFHEDEVEIAVELVDERLRQGPASGYEFVLAEQDGGVVGYTCYGPIPCTASSYDLYWIAVHPKTQGQGLGRSLMAETERRIRELGGTRVYAETSSRPQYLSTRAFYERTGYKLAEMLEDFYAPGDGRATYLKVLG